MIQRNSRKRAQEAEDNVRNDAQVKDKVEQREDVAKDNQHYDAEKQDHLEQRENVGKNINGMLLLFQFSFEAKNENSIAILLIQQVNLLFSYRNTIVFSLHN